MRFWNQFSCSLAKAFELLFWSFILNGLCSITSPHSAADVQCMSLVNVGLETKISVLGIDLKQTLCAYIL